MVQRRSLAVLLLILVAMGAALDSSAAAELRAPARIALVVGNGNYSHNPLKNALNDADDVAAALKAFGFTTLLFRDLDTAGFKRAVREFEDKLEEGGRGSSAIFFFAGHGVQVGGKNYLLPISVNYQDHRDVIDFGVDLEQLLSRVEEQRPDVAIFVVDACRDDPLPARARSLLGTGLARMDAPAGVLLAFATSPGRTASDNTGERNGLFTKYFLQHVGTPGLTAEQVFRRVRTDVYRASRGRQLPEDSNRLIGGDFFFVPPAPAATVATRGEATTSSPQMAALRPAEIALPVVPASVQAAAMPPATPPPASELAVSTQPAPKPTALPELVAKAPSGVTELVARVPSSPGQSSAPPIAASEQQTLKVPAPAANTPKASVESIPASIPAQGDAPPAVSGPPLRRPSSDAGGSAQDAVVPGPVALAAAAPAKPRAVDLAALMSSAPGEVLYAMKDGITGLGSEITVEDTDPATGTLNLSRGFVLQRLRVAKAAYELDFEPPIPLVADEMRVGTAWKYSGKASMRAGALASGDVSSDFTVLAREEHVTPMARFDTFKVREVRWVGNMKYEFTRWMEASSGAMVAETALTLSGSPPNVYITGMFVAPRLSHSLEWRGRSVR